jgi:hypothetical protein
MPKGFQKGHKGFKEKGSVTKTTLQAKELIYLAIENQSEFIPDTLEKIRLENPIEYMKIVSKLLTFILPTKVEQTTTIQGEVPIDKWLS